MKVFAFAASLRKDSLNKKLIRLASDFARKQGIEMDLAQFNEFEIPLYNGDVQTTSGIPPGVEALKERIKGADGLMISSPEYNFSMPGTIKNAIDWLSRIKPVPLENKWALLMSASPSMVGGNRGLWSLRVPLEVLGVFVYPEMFSLAKAHETFDENGSLKDLKSLERLEKVIRSFLKTLKS